MSKTIKFTEQKWQRDGTFNFLAMGRPFASVAHTELDVTLLLERIRHYQRESKIVISLHGVMIYYFAQAVRQHPEILTYRYGNKLISFQDADISTVILKKLPNNQRDLEQYCFRKAQEKSMAEIQWELRTAMKTPLAGISKREHLLKRLWMRFVCWRMFHNPFLFKEHMGNLFITNLQSPGLNIPFNIVAPNPYTLALAIGSVTNQIRPDKDGKPIVRKILSVSGIADHAVVDGFPLSRFSVTVSQLLESATGLNDDFVKEMLQFKKGESK